MKDKECETREESLMSKLKDIKDKLKELEIFEKNFSEFEEKFTIYISDEIEIDSLSSVENLFNEIRYILLSEAKEIKLSLIN
jgi:hypothetical protein